jgi:predicted TIM-barrel fold metal-dependent hydrolase
VSPPLSVPAIDVHAHFLSDAYRDALATAGIDRPDGFPHVPDWDPDAVLAVMDGVGIAAAVLSISSPGVHFAAGEPTRTLARRVNEDGAAAVAAHPDRFGLLASLPLPDADAALEEIAYACDVLHADGFVMMTNYDGVYPGDPSLAAVMEELDRRGAVVALHPTSPPGWEGVALGRPRPMIEFPFDTTRAVVDLILGGTLARNPRIELIVPHAGSALPAIADRVDTFARLFLSGPDERPIDVAAQLGRLHYDLTGAALPHALPALLLIAGTDRLLFGTDLPFAPEVAVTRAAQGLEATDVLDGPARVAMLSGNAARLFPRLAGDRVRSTR